MSDFLDASVPLSQYTQAFGDTLYMVCVALFIGSVIGIPVGVLLAITRKDGLRENRIVYVVLNTVVNIVRSVPFIILMVAIMPFTRLVVHTSIGTQCDTSPLLQGHETILNAWLKAFDAYICVTFAFQIFL